MWVSSEYIHSFSYPLNILRTLTGLDTLISSEYYSQLFLSLEHLENSHMIGYIDILWVLFAACPIPWTSWEIPQDWIPWYPLSIIHGLSYPFNIVRTLTGLDTLISSEYYSRLVLSLEHLENYPWETSLVDNNLEWISQQFIFSLGTQWNNPFNFHKLFFKYLSILKKLRMHLPKTMPAG